MAVTWTHECCGKGGTGGTGVIGGAATRWNVPYLVYDASNLGKRLARISTMALALRCDGCCVGGCVGGVLVVHQRYASSIHVCKLAYRSCLSLWSMDQ
jgi:hypothetical protein